jgi:hypothetical protein
MRITGASMGHGLALAAAGAFTLSLAGAAAAQNAPATGRAPNLYLGLAVGESDASYACEGIAGCDKRDNAFGAFAGYWVHRHFSIEVGYHNLGEITAPGGTYLRSNVWELLAVGYWPVTPPLSLYGKLGPYRGAQEGGGLYADQKELTNSITYGVGAQFDLSKNAGVRAEFQAYPSFGTGPVLPHGDINVVRLSALWRFQ